MPVPANSVAVRPFGPNDAARAADGGHARRAAAAGQLRATRAPRGSSVAADLAAADPAPAGEGGAGYASLAALPSSSAAGSSSSAFDAASSAFDGDDASSVADSSALDASSVGGGSDGEGGYAVDAASEAGSSLFDQSEGEADGASAFGESEVSDGGASEVSELTFGAPSEGGF